MIEIRAGTCVIYVRVSTRRQVTHRVDDEIELCVNFATQHGLIVLERFVDEGATGFNGYREGYRRMEGYIREQKGRVQYVLVPDLSRLSRDTSEYASFRVMTQRHGIIILSVREGAVGESPAARLIDGTLTLAASYDATVKKELSAQSQRRMVESGLWPFRAPLGYRHGTVKGYLVVDEDVAPSIRQLFGLVGCEGVSIAELPSRAAELNLHRSSKPLSSSEQYRRILTNPLYAGRIVLESGLRATAQFEPLVDSDTFDAAQTRLAGRAAVKRRGERRLPLSGLVICRECGYALSGGYAKGTYGWYRCKKGCASVRDSEFHEMFIRFANTLTANSETECELTEIVVQRSSGTAKREDTKLVEQLESISDRKDRLIQWLQDGTLQLDEWQRRMEAERARGEQLHARLDAVSAHANADSKLIQQITARTLAHPGDLWKALPVTLQRRLQDALFPEGLALDEGQFTTHAINPVFNGFGGPFMQIRTVASPCGKNLELQRRPWHRLPREERERRMAQYFDDEFDLGDGPLRHEEVATASAACERMM